MKKLLNSLRFLIVLLLFPGVFNGQDLKIPLSSEFLDSSKEYKVKKKPSSSTINKKKWKKNWNCFGSYVVGNWDNEVSEQKNKANFWQTKFEQMNYKEWNYEVFASGVDTLEVEVAYNFSSKEKGAVHLNSEVFPISFGQDELISKSLNIAVMMGSPGSQDEPWLFLLSLVESSEQYAEFKGLLAKGDRTIEVLPVESDAKSNFGMIQGRSQGYVFRENGREIAAVQNMNANIMKRDDRFVWLDSSLDDTMQLNLSAAISVLLLLNEDVNYRTNAGQSGIILD